MGIELVFCLDYHARFVSGVFVIHLPRIVTVFVLMSALVAGCHRMTEDQLDPEGQSPEQGWESSGGSGVVCFKDSSRAEQADRALRAKGYLDPEDRGAVESVHLLDRWEATDRLHFTRFEKYTREAITAEVLIRFTTGAPLFAHRLGLVSKKLSTSKWTDSKKLKPIADATPYIEVAKKDPRCRVVQLVARHTRSRKGYLPEVRLDIDNELVGRLTPLDLAMLRFHEELYLIAKESIYKDSDKVREVVAYFFSDEIIEHLQYWLRNEERIEAEKLVTIDDKLPIRVIQEPIHKLLGDYTDYFLMDPLARPKKVGKSPSQYSRYLSFVAMIDLLHRRLGDCYRRERFAPKTPPPNTHPTVVKCKEQATDLEAMTKLLTAEQAFLFITYYFTEYRRGVQNTENLIVFDPEDGSTLTPKQGRELNNACSSLPQAIAMFEGSERLGARALDYCKSANRAKR